MGTIKSRFSLGGEYQYQNQLGNTFTIINDQPGTWPEPGDLYQNDIVKSTSNMLFAQAEFDLPAKTFLTIGASYMRLKYDILDLYKDPAHVDYSGLLQFPDKISPRIGLVKLINDHIAVHGSLSSGYSPPPVWEINNYDGTLNKDIKPEDGLNYEAGIRGDFLHKRFNFDITAYQMYLKNAIVPVAQPNGTMAYKNAGLTSQQGIEAFLSFLVLNHPEKAISLLKPWVSYTYNNYIFKDYETQSFDWGSSSVITVDHSGNHVTGVVPHSLSAGVDLHTRYGLYFNTLLYYYDRIPLNDANTYYSDSYTLLNMKLGCRKDIKRCRVDIFGGINNMTDTNYSSLLLYNADANGSPQFYNPSAGVNYYGGLSLTYNLK
ncbi:TonB-dependent receptor [Sphingobacterium sp. SGG-5]|nr:TonB-dependent receptor [Sphingobacterium sp. SGG-5]NGM60612.1 TonB-dependent receptor [Sphingobacterium sp. SGG-5]